MKDGIEGLIESTIAHIKIALDNNKPGEAKVYTEILELLGHIASIPQESRIDKLFSEFKRNQSLRDSIEINKPFEKIPERNNPNV